MTVPATFASIVLGSLAGYVFAKLPFRGSEILFLILVSGMFFPPQVILIPLFRLFNSLGLIDTLWPIFLVHTALGIPICSLLMRNFFQRYQLKYAKLPYWMARMNGKFLQELLYH